MGLHTGTPLVTDEGYVGADVHRAARIAASGHGGQVLVSASTAALADLELRDLGEHRFKDLAAPERVFQLGEGEYPPIRSLRNVRLPAARSSRRLRIRNDCPFVLKRILCAGDPLRRMLSGMDQERLLGASALGE
jgi:hypothetical protein